MIDYDDTPIAPVHPITSSATIAIAKVPTPPYPAPTKSRSLPPWATDPDTRLQNYIIKYMHFVVLVDNKCYIIESELCSK